MFSRDHEVLISNHLLLAKQGVEIDEYSWDVSVISCYYATGTDANLHMSMS